jgi:electron transfer flavoprotein alpha subunit
MAYVLVVLEQRDGKIKRVGHEALAAARTLADAAGGEVHGLVIGGGSVDADGLGAFGADRVTRVADAAAELYQAESYAETVAAVARADDCTTVLLSATAQGKDLGPRVAAKLDCPLAADVTAIQHDGNVIVTRPVYSGKATYTICVTAPRVVISVRPNAYAPVASDKAGTVSEGSLSAGRDTRAVTKAIEQPERAALDVAEASIVVSGGRGLKEAEHFKLVEDLADVLGGAVGASRAVVDAGWRPHSEQVGQTGKTVSPSLYFALGISGAVQHLAGMRTAKVIVAINKDADAPIFKVADYGIVGDLFEIVPRLTDEIRALKEN